MCTVIVIVLKSGSITILEGLQYYWGHRYFIEKKGSTKES